MEAGDSPRIVLVHDWLTGMRGGEKCLQVLCERWPEAPLYSLIHRPGTVAASIESRPIRTSLLQYLPGVHRYYRNLLPLMPSVASHRLPACDLAVSLSHCVAKAAVPPEGTPHLCYCFTPMRYAWHMREAYFGRGLKARLIDEILERLRHWDRATSDRVSQFVAISQTVGKRIQECYGRQSTVIHPPVDTEFYCPADVAKEEFYLVFSAFAPYKRLDLAVEACRRLKKSLVVIGSGQEEKNLRKLAGPTVNFLGWQSDEVIRDYLRRARGLLFPGEEDFGIVPVEAQACGTPVIAFGRGGATETVVPLNPDRDPTGHWFAEQTVDCLIEAIEVFERNRERFSPAACRRQALRFTKGRFAEEIHAAMMTLINPRSSQLRHAA